MNSEKKHSNTFTSASGFVITDADRHDVLFSDIKIIGRSELNYIATGIRYGKHFIIKGLNEELRHDEGCLAMLRKEFEILIGINYSGIRKALSFEYSEELGPHIVMEYLEGKSLREWLSKPHELPDRLRIALQIGETLKHLHSLGIVHRDIKPENIIITHIGEKAVLIDFGLADTDEYAILKHPAGTEGYIAPEQKGTAVPDPRNDLYSYGKILEELLPEKRFQRIIRNCRKDIDRRPQRAEDVIKAIRESASYKKPLFICVIILLMLCVAVFCFLFFNDTPKDSDPLKTEVLKSDSEENHEVDVITDPAVMIAVEDENFTSGLEDIREGQPKETMQLDVVSDVAATGQVTAKKTEQLDQRSGTGTSGDRVSFSNRKMELYKLGVQTIDLAWDQTAGQYLDTVKNTSRLRTSWGLDTVRMAKLGFLESLEYSLEHSDELIREHGHIEMTQKDWNELDRMLESHIQDLYNKWKQRIKKMKSKP